jgi:hypothetical protein
VFTKNGAIKKASILKLATKVNDKSSRNEIITFNDCIELYFTELPLILIGTVNSAKTDSVRVNKNPENINICLSLDDTDATHIRITTRKIIDVVANRRNIDCLK